MKDKLSEFFKRYDFSFFLAMGLIFTIGIFNLYSATNTQIESTESNLYKTQLIWFGLALIIGFIVSLINVKTIFRFSYLFYFINVVLLVLVLFLGKEGMGAVRWIAFGPIRFQPSEFCKLAIVFALSRWYATSYPHLTLGLTNIIFPLIIASVPAVLIMLQPDLGTGGMLILIFLVMTFYRKLQWSSIIKVVFIGIIGATLMYNFALRDYQKKRVQNFIDPYQDAKGSGYNAIQSQIAIGSGLFLGKGFMKSSQASLNFLPENHTDFIFSVYNEEHGFLGSLILISLFLFLLLRLIWLARSVDRIFDSILVIGIMAIFFWHTLINMSMVAGLFPIVGIPLPFMSYGGSNLLTFGISIGIVTSISNERRIF